MSAFESIKRHATPDIQKENKFRFFFFLMEERWGLGDRKKKMYQEFIHYYLQSF